MCTVPSLQRPVVKKQRRLRNIISLRHPFRQPYRHLIVFHRLVERHNIRLYFHCDLRLRLESDPRHGAIIFSNFAMSLYGSGLTGGRISCQSSSRYPSKRVRHTTLRCKKRTASGNHRAIKRMSF